MPFKNMVPSRMASGPTVVMRARYVAYILLSAVLHARQCSLHTTECSAAYPASSVTTERSGRCEVVSDMTLRAAALVGLVMCAGHCMRTVCVRLVCVSLRFKKKKNRPDITPDPGGHRPQRPCAQGRTCAKKDQPQASASGQNQTQFGGGATTHGLRTRQAGKSVPTQTRPGDGGCTPQSTPQEGTRNKIQTPQLHVPRGHTAQGSCRVEQERDNTSRGSNNGDMPGRKRRQQHRLRVVRPRAHPEVVIHEKGKCYRAVQARDTLAFKQQVFNMAPSVRR